MSDSRQLIAKSRQSSSKRVPIRLRYRANLDLVIDIVAAGRDGLAVECEQLGILNRLFQDRNRRLCRKTLGFLQQCAQHDDIGDLRRSQAVRNFRGWNTNDTSLWSRKPHW